MVISPVMRPTSPNVSCNSLRGEKKRRCEKDNEEEEEERKVSEKERERGEKGGNTDISDYSRL